jgi:hypothetical protein
MREMRRKLALLALGLAATSAAIAVPVHSNADPADPPDPATIPLPAFDDAAADPAKSLVVRLDFTSRTATALRSAVVSTERAHSHLGDPPILRLTLADPDGQVIDRMNAWSPLWVFTNDGHERLEIQPSGSGSFVVPFSPTLSSLTVRDVELARDVATVDLAGPIQDFCAEHPGDPDCREADLSVDSITPAAPLFAVLGEPATVTVTSRVSNAGPDGPADARVTRLASAGTGLTIAAVGDETVDVPSLAVGAPRSVATSYTVTCTEPGRQAIDLSTSVAPKYATWVDPDPANNSRSTQFTVDCAVPVTINVLPGSTRNPVDRTGSTLPVAVLTTGAGEYGNPLAFDATTIDAASVRFASRSRLLAGGGVPELHTAVHPEDSLELDEVTLDGDLDGLLHFRPRADAIALADTEGCVFGRAAGDSGPVSFFGCDRIDVIR